MKRLISYVSASQFLVAAVLVLLAVGKTAVSASVTPYPNLSWPLTEPFAEYKVEIANDPDFTNIIDRDRIAHVARYRLGITRIPSLRLNRLPDRIRSPGP